jgi:hypothetical protein
MTAVGMPATLLENGYVLSTGVVLLKIEFRHFPNAITEGKEDLPLGFDQSPNV